LTVIVPFSAGQARRQELRHQTNLGAGQSGTVSAKTWNSVAVKLS